MGANSKIEWTTHTFNPWRGCTKISEGCKNCYADKLSERNPKVLGEWGPNGTRVIASEAYWREPIKWNQAAKSFGERARVFCASLADVGEDRSTMPESAWPEVQMTRRRLSALILSTPWLVWLLLTKRPDNMLEFFGETVLRRCWVGTSVENQARADERIPQLLKCPAAIRFLSCEPLLGPVNLVNVKCIGAGHGVDAPCSIDLVIAGGESGPSARPMHPDWARSLRDQCVAGDVPFFFKQWGEWAPRSHLTREQIAFKGGRQWGVIGPDGKYAEKTTPFNGHDDDGEGLKESIIVRVGKHAAGRLLDGREWNGIPRVPMVVVS